ncbi:hypothetical protein NST08_00530 [Paenibacillus sp. FSL K6-1566]|jgi:hypothetical protein|uniref:hypothetical protein n=1 Tax=Paenibacillus sp. FSL K6-1566 TaxID=2954515 RepID=UPI003101302A
MMCPICRYETEEGKYCEQCGARLIIEDKAVFTAFKEQAAASEVYGVHQGSTRYRGSSQGEKEMPVYIPPDIPFHTAGRQHVEEEAVSNPYWESIKLYGQIYGDYVVKGLKHPIASASATDGSQLLNATVSMLLYVLFLPLLGYVTLSFDGAILQKGAFVHLVLKPMGWLALFLFLLNVFTFTAVKLSNYPGVKLKEAMARFGTFLIPFLALLVISPLFLFINSDITTVILILSFVSTVITIPVLVMNSYKRKKTGGLDPLYAILLVYAASLLVLALIWDIFTRYLITSL